MKYSDETIGVILGKLGFEDRATDEEIVREILEALESTDEQRALRAKLADCQAVIRSRGHAEGCPARHCSFVGFTGRCGESPAWHKVVKVGHEYQSPPCYESCGHDRTTGEKA